ncbi:hypothetical protein [Bacillus sp. B1-b2]|uniref:hypothetical protein n=1 Tax=Bacillus sp. B1-b2 TaxID=2653201 RepID=UPI001261BACB|nr:hypothetical protein [Bacillus sp. B1-b2]KAB7663025.1 hypothetical protein F9279_24330 [Bacillus sp. B1-b2]
MKKFLPIFLSAIVLFSSFFLQVEKTRANPALAVPVIAGGVLLGALGLAAVADFAGADQVASDINNFAEKTEGFIMDTAINSTIGLTKWVTKTATAVPDLVLDLKGATTDTANTIKTTAGNITANYIGHSIGSTNAKTTYGEYDVIPYEATTPIKMQTAYPEFSVRFSGPYVASQSLAFELNNFDSTNANSRIFMISYKGEIYFTNSFRLEKTTYFPVITNSDFTYQLSKGLTPINGARFNTSIDRTAYSRDIVNAPLYPTAEMALPTFSNNLLAKGMLSPMLVTVTTVGAMNQIFQRQFDNIADKTYEKYRETSVTINGEAILEANPTLEWDGTAGTFRDKATGTAVGTDALAMPQVGVYEGAVAVPVGNTWAPVDTGVIVGNPTIPGGGTGEGDGGSTSKPKLNMTPLTIALGTIKDKFPFSIPWDFQRMLERFNLDPKTPIFKIGSKENIELGGITIPVDYDFDINFSFFDPVAKIARWGLILAFDIWLVFALRRMTPD